MSKIDQVLEILNEHTKKLDSHDEKLKSHDEKFQEITEILKSHDEKFQEITEILKSHDEKFQEIFKILESIHEGVILIENDIHDKVPALFDGYTFHQEHLTRHDDEIEDLQKREENHSIRIISLEDDTKEHSKQLQRLASSN